MRWVVTLYGTRQDAERLIHELPELSAVEDSPSEYYRDLHLELDDPEGDAPEEDAMHVGRAVIEAHVRRINGFGRLRWGRTFEGVEITEFTTVDSEGETTTVHFLDRPVEYMLPEDYAEGADRHGIPRAKLPVGIEALSALGGESVAALAGMNRSVALVLRLVDEMLRGEEEIDWGAAYSALEAIEQDLHDRGLKGQDLGWWTGAERDRFRATANSVEVLGDRKSVV